MSLNLIITLVCVSLFLIILTTYFLKKGRIPEKYSLLWYVFSLIIMLVGIFPNLFGIVSSTLGFQTISNLIIGIIIFLLMLLNMALTIMIAGQKKKNTLLIQEISILKQKVQENERRK